MEIVLRSCDILYFRIWLWTGLNLNLPHIIPTDELVPLLNSEKSSGFIVLNPGLL